MLGQMRTLRSVESSSLVVKHLGWIWRVECQTVVTTPIPILIHKAVCNYTYTYT